MITSFTSANTPWVHHRVLKCTVSGGDHSRLHCLVLCNSCSGGKWRCDCQSRPPPHKKKTQKDPETDYEKLYSKLMFNAMNESESLSRHCKRRTRIWQLIYWEKIEKSRSWTAAARKYADLVKTKEKVIADLKKSLVMAKTHRLAMREEIPSLQATNAVAVDEEPGKQKAHCASTQPWKHPWMLQ